MLHLLHKKDGPEERSSAWKRKALPCAILYPTQEGPPPCAAKSSAFTPAWAAFPIPPAAVHLGVGPITASPTRASLFRAFLLWLLPGQKKNGNGKPPLQTGGGVIFWNIQQEASQQSSRSRQTCSGPQEHNAKKSMATIWNPREALEHELQASL